MSLGAIRQFAKVAIGTPDLSKTTISNFSAAGILTNPGVTFFGAALSVGVAKAAVNIGPPAAIPGVALPLSLWVDGISQFNGILNIYGNINQYSLETSFGAKIAKSLGIKNGVDIKNALNIGNSQTVINGNLIVAGTVVNGYLEGRINAAMASPPKGFDMHHPTKKGWRLTHICIEGPEAAVYFRGKSRTDVIELPEYWKGLVHEDSITVNLTPVGSNQNLYIKSIFDNKIVVGGGAQVKGGEREYDFHYTVYGERKDVDKIIVEYEGKIEDYPGEDQRSIVGYHYDYREGVNG